MEASQFLCGFQELAADRKSKAPASWSHSIRFAPFGATNSRSVWSATSLLALCVLNATMRRPLKRLGKEMRPPQLSPVFWLYGFAPKPHFFAVRIALGQE